MLCHSDLWLWSKYPEKVTQPDGGQRFNPSANLKLGRILETLGGMVEKERRGFEKLEWRECSHYLVEG